MLRDQRIAAKRSDMVTRHEDLANLRDLLRARGAGSGILLVGAPHA